MIVNMSRKFSFNFIFFVIFFFVNDFDVHRNMYRALKVLYFILINLFYEKRRKLINVFKLILNFYDVAIDNVIEVLTRAIKQKNRNINFDINKNVEKIYAFVIKLIENIFQ